MPDAPAEPQAAQLNRDLVCTHCGYNLRGLLTTGRCPECGQDILTSIRGQTLYYCDDQWLGRQRLWIIIMAGVATLHVLRDMGFCLTSEALVRRLMPPALAICDYLAVWNLTQREPGARRHDEQTRTRLILRGSAMIRVVLDLTFVVLPQYFHSTLSEATLQFWIPWVWRMLMAAWATEAGLLLWYLRPLALRLPAPALALKLRILAILLPLAFIAVCLCNELSDGHDRSEVTLALAVLGVLALLSAKVLFDLYRALGQVDDGMGALDESAP